MEPNFVLELEHLNQFITSCVVKWKTGYDAGGYQDFRHSLEQLESTVQTHFDRLREHMEVLISILENLNQLIENKDIIAVTDLMEYQLQPLVFEWRKGCE